MAKDSSKSPRRKWLRGCGGCIGVFVLGCCAIFAVAALAPSFRPSARDVYSGAPDLAAGEDVAQALIDSGVEGASVLVIPIKGGSGQIAILTLDESRGYNGFSASGTDSLKIVVSNIVAANQTGDYHIERLSIDYRDETGQSSLAFTTTITQAEEFAAGSITQEQFVGNVEFNLTDTLRYYGVDQLLLQGEQP
jgi:hypothetical protein